MKTITPVKSVEKVRTIIQRLNKSGSTISRKQLLAAEYKVHMFLIYWFKYKVEPMEYNPNKPFASFMQLDAMGYFGDNALGYSGDAISDNRVPVPTTKTGPIHPLEEQSDLFEDLYDFDEDVVENFEEQYEFFDEDLELQMMAEIDFELRKKRSRPEKYQQSRKKHSEEWNNGSQKSAVNSGLMNALYCKRSRDIVCSSCDIDLTNGTIYCCRTCSFVDNLCLKCIYRIHLINKPCHDIIVDCNNGLGYVEISITDMFSADFQAELPSLGNCHARSCTKTYAREIALIGLNSASNFTVHFCGCDRSLLETQQLIEYGFWPTHFQKNNLAFSLDLLKCLRVLNLNSQVSPYKFVHSLKELLGNRRLKIPSNIYDKLLTSFYLYRSAISEIESLSTLDIPGMVEINSSCPACPRKNEEGSVHISFDGNFRLARLKKSNNESYQTRGIQRFIASTSAIKEELELNSKSPHINEEQVCDQFKAGDKIRSQSRYKAFDETGIMGLFCARHDIPLAFVDMYHGERYVYPDLLLKHFLKNRNQNQTIYLYYDICCKYSIHLGQLKELEGFKIIPAIPKMHCNAHEEKCRRLMHPERIDGCGLTDAEGCERNWSYLGDFAHIVKEMGACTRHDQLEDAIAHFRKAKIMNLMNSLDKKRTKASENLSTATEAFEKLNIEESQCLNLLTAERNETLHVEIMNRKKVVGVVIENDLQRKKKSLREVLLN